MIELTPALARYLDDLGHGRYSTTTPYGPDDVGIVLGGLPSSPDRVIGLIQYPAGPSNANEPYDLVNVQVRVRGTSDERDSGRRAQLIYDALHGLGVTDLPGGVRVVNVIGLQGGPTWVSTDSNNRHEHVINVRVEVRNPARE